MAKEKKPIHEVRVGAIRLSIWSNESRFGSRWFSLTLGRIYKDANEQWQVSQSFKQQHLSDLAQAISTATQWLDEHSLTPKAETLLREVVQSAASRGQNSKGGNNER